MIAGGVLNGQSSWNQLRDFEEVRCCEIVDRIPNQRGQSIDGDMSKSSTDFICGAGPIIPANAGDAEAASLAVRDNAEAASTGDSGGVRRIVYVVDDDAIVMSVLGVMLDQAGFEAVCTSSAHDFLTQLPTLRPGMVITDQVMSETTGLELLRQLVEQRPNDFRFILISAYPRTSLTVSAMKLGAITVLDKPFDRRELLQGLAEGFRRLNAAEDTDLTLPPLLPPGESYLDRLSGREREVILMVYQGKTNKGISIGLNLSIKTVEKHRARAMRKMAVKSLAGLIRLIDREMELGILAGIRRDQ